MAVTDHCDFRCVYCMAENMALLSRQQILGIEGLHWLAALFMQLADFPDTRIGFISPNSHNFYASCNRVHLTAEGRLLLCLGHEHSVDLRALLRHHPQDDSAVVEADSRHCNANHCAMGSRQMAG